MSFGIHKSALLRTGHRVSANEICFHIQTNYLFVDGSLHASDICENTVFIQEIFQLGKIGCVVSDRCAEENVVTSPEIVVNGWTGSMNSAFLDCQCKGFFIFIECDDVVIRIILADCLRNRAADKSKSDKSNFFSIHSCKILSVVVQNISYCSEILNQ